MRARDSSQRSSSRPANIARALPLLLLVIQTPDRRQHRFVSPPGLSGIIAATSFKQRVRKMVEITMRTDAGSPLSGPRTESNTIRASS